MMALETFTDDCLVIKKEIEEDLLLSDEEFDTKLELIKTFKQKGDVWLEDNKESEDESEDEKPVGGLLCSPNTKLLKEESDDEDDDKSLFLSTLIKAEPLSPVKEEFTVDIRRISTDSSDKTFVPIKEELIVDDPSVVVKESDIVNNFRNDTLSSRHDSAVDLSNAEPQNPYSPQRKRKLSTEHSDGLIVNSQIESNNNTQKVKRKCVHFAEEDSLKSTRIFEQSGKLVTFTPSSKEPGVGILKNKLSNDEPRSKTSSVRANKYAQKKKGKLVRNRKEGKKTKSTPSELDVPKNNKLKKNLNKTAKGSSPIKGKRKNSLIKNAARITDFFSKKNKDPDKAKKSKNDTNELDQKENSDSVRNESQININNVNRTIENRKENSSIVPSIQNVFKHCQKRKSKKQYAYKCPVLAYLCICGTWCKSGPELNGHLSVCTKLQPRVILTKLKL